MLDRITNAQTHMGHQDPMSAQYDNDRTLDDFDKAMHQGKWRHDGLIIYKLPETKTGEKGGENVAKNRDTHNK